MERIAGLFGTGHISLTIAVHLGAVTAGEAQALDGVAQIGSAGLDAGEHTVPGVGLVAVDIAAGRAQIAGPGHGRGHHDLLDVALQIAAGDGLVALDALAGDLVLDAEILLFGDVGEGILTHHLYLLRIDPEIVGGNIQQLSKKLAEKGLTNITHFGPMYRFKIMKDFGYDEEAIAATCPNTEKMFYHSYTHLPLYPLTQEQLEYQAKAVVEAVREMKAGK